MANRLEGASRPGHFDGVLTVVMKLFQLVQPHCAIFGKKDYQQLAIIRKMVTDYLLPLAIVPAETSRESDGLARSSRNRYFDDQHRSIAPLISAGLQEAAQLFSRGERQTAKLRETVLAKISSHPAFAVEYVEICRRDSLEPCGEQITEAAVILVAARLAGVRLIDNWELD